MNRSLRSGVEKSAVSPLRLFTIISGCSSNVLVRATPFFRLVSRCAEVEGWIRTELLQCCVGGLVELLASITRVLAGMSKTLPAETTPPT